MKAFGPSFFLFQLIPIDCQKFHENMGGNMKPQRGGTAKVSNFTGITCDGFTLCILSV
jgi:hypothetical protein